MSYYSRSHHTMSDWYRYCEEQHEEEARLPVCNRCKHKIDDDYLFVIDGEIMCEDCVKDEYQRPTEEYMEELI